MVGREQNTGAMAYPQNRILCRHIFSPHPPQKAALTLSLHMGDLLTIKVEIVRGGTNV